MCKTAEKSGGHLGTAEHGRPFAEAQVGGADDADAREKMEAWRRYYNTDRFHSAIGNKPPISLTKGSSAASAP